MVIYLVLQVKAAREAMQDLIDANTKLIAEVRMSAHVAHACLLLVSCLQEMACLHFEQSKSSSADRYNPPKVLDIAPLMHWCCNHQTLQRLPKHTVSGMQTGCFGDSTGICNRQQAHQALSTTRSHCASQ